MIVNPTHLKVGSLQQIIVTERVSKKKYSKYNGTQNTISKTT